MDCPQKGGGSGAAGHYDSAVLLQSGGNRMPVSILGGIHETFTEPDPPKSD